MDANMAMLNPYDSMGQQALLRQKLAMALMQGGLTGMGAAPQQGQMVSGHYIPPNYVAQLQPVMQMLMGASMQKNAGAGLAQAQSGFQNAQAQALSNYMNLRSGTPATPETEGNNPSAFVPAQAGVPGQPRSAAMAGIASPFPALQTIGKEDLDTINKGAPTAAGILSNPQLDPKAALAAIIGAPEGAPNLSLLAPKPETHVIGERAFSGVPGGPVRDVGGISYSPVGTVANVNGQPVIGQKQDASGKVDFAPPGMNVNLNTVDTASNRFAGKVAETRASNLAASYDKAQMAQTGLASLNDAKAALDAGMKTGAGADFKLGLAKAGKALGLSDDPQIANTEQYRSEMATRVFAIIKNLGSGTAISNSDRDYASQAAAGDIKLDDKAMYRLVQIGRAGAMSQLMQHEDLIGKNAGASGAIPADLEAMRVPFTFKAPEFQYDPDNRRLILPELGQKAFEGGAELPSPQGATKGTAENPFSLEEYLGSLGSH